MVRSRWVKAFLASLVTAGMAWGQQAAAPPSPPVDPWVGRVMNVAEAGKPNQKAKVLQTWVDEHGNRVLKAEACDTHEMLTIVIPQNSPVTQGSPPRTGPLTTRIFHWRDRKPPEGCPEPPGTIVACPTCTEGTKCTPVVQSPAPPVIRPIPTNPIASTDCPPCTTGSGGSPYHSTPVIVNGSTGLPIIETVPGGKIVPANPNPCDCLPTVPDTKVTTLPPVKPPPKPVEVEPAKIPDWRQSRQSWDDKKPAPVDPKKAETRLPPIDDKKPVSLDDKKPTPRVELPHAETKRPDPLMDPVQVTRRPVEPTPPARTEVAPSAPVTRESAPTIGTKSIADAGATNFEPRVALPPMNMGPAPTPPNPNWRVPQAPAPFANRPPAQANEGTPAGGIAYNAFTPSESVPPEPGSPELSMRMNAFSSGYAVQSVPHGVPQGMSPPPGPYPPPAGNPGMAAQGPRPGMGMGPTLPPAPYGPSVQIQPTTNPAMQGTQVAMLTPRNPISQAGYNQPAPTTSNPAVSHNLSTLRDALLPSDREEAAEKLATLDWKTNDVAVQALIQSAKTDPSATVRSICIRSLGKMRVNTMPVVTTIQALTNDGDVRVRTEAQKALAVLAPGMSAPASN
jgi:hypothetical protein